MSPILASLAIGIMTTGARWAKGKTLDVDTVVGVLVLAVILSVLDSMNPKFGRAFSLLAVVAVGLVHGNTILDATGLTGKRKGGGT